MSLERTAREMVREYLVDHPSATIDEVAAMLSRCGCIGCPKRMKGESCDCGAGCRCRCTSEPYKTQNEENRAWRLDVARRALSAGERRD